MSCANGVASAQRDTGFAQDTGARIRRSVQLIRRSPRSWPRARAFSSNSGRADRLLYRRRVVESVCCGMSGPQRTSRLGARTLQHGVAHAVHAGKRSFSLIWTICDNSATYRQTWPLPGRADPLEHLSSDSNRVTASKHESHVALCQLSSSR